MISQVNTTDGRPMICTIVSDYPEMDEVVRDWAPIAGKHYGHLGSARVSVGPVLSAGQFQEYIKGSGELRTSQVLYDSSVV